jgi:hypothetical protein
VSESYQNGRQTQPEVIRWIKAIDSKVVKEIIATNANAYTLAAVIALRTQWKKEFNRYGLEVGEALIGDYEEFGMTRGQYRHALNQLVKWGFVTIKTTTKGTIARLTDSRLFDPLNIGNNQQNNQLTAIEPPSINHRTTTSKNLRSKEPEEVKEEHSGDAEEIYQAYPRKTAKSEGLKAIAKQLRSHSAAMLLEKTKAFAALWPGDCDLTYCPYPSTWFNQQCFNDDPKTWARSKPTQQPHRAESNQRKEEHLSGAVIGSDGIARIRKTTTEQQPVIEHVRRI